LSRSEQSDGLGLSVPPVGPGVCAICHGPARDGRRECWCCRAVSSALGADLVGCPLVVPIGLYRTGDGLHRVLRGYKDAPAVAARRHFARRLGTYFASFLEGHGACIADAAPSTWDSVAVVPSSARGRRPRGRFRAPAPPHPLAAVLGAVPSLADVRRIDLEPGAGSADHLAPDPAAFEVSGEARGRRVLLLDDTWVTGARVRSAAATLGAAGAEVAAMVVAGRAVGAVETAPVPALARWWQWAEARDHSGAPPWGPCCLVDCAHRSAQHPPG
jgi:hypothetical protein